MEAPSWYFEQDSMMQNEEYIHINDHLLELSYIENDIEQLIDELYDEVEQLDPDVVHGLVKSLCDKLDMKLPNRENLKL